jgi:hypothetical protein
MTVFKVLTKLHDVFPAAGMTLTTNAFYAIGTSTFITFPAVSTSGTVGGAASCGKAWLQVGTASFSAYNPYTETAGSDTACYFFPWGVTPEASLQNLANAVTANTPYAAVASGTGPNLLYLTYTAKVAGPAANYLSITPDGAFGVGGVPTGGGYEYQTSSSSATGYKIQTLGVGGGWNGGLLNPNDGRVAFNIIVGTNTKSYLLDSKTFDLTVPITQYTVLANPYGFAIFDPNNDTHFLANTSLLVQAPCITEFTDCTSLVLMVDPGKFRDSTSYWQSCTIYLNGAMTSFSDGPYPQPLALRSPGPTPLLTLANTPVVMGTYLFLGGTSGATRKVLGKLWDCAMVGDYITTAMILNSLKHERVSAQTGTTSSSSDTRGGTYQTRSSLLWRYDSSA